MTVRRRLRGAPHQLRAAVWSTRSVRLVRAHLRENGGVRAPVPVPPDLPATAVRGLGWGLRLASATCLEGALVRQEWYRVHGRRRDVVIGVAQEDGGTLAHAWLEGEPTARPYVEMTRVVAR